MGHFLSRFRNVEPEDVLDRLEADIKDMERDRQRQDYYEKRSSKRCMITFVIFSIIYLTYLIYILATVHDINWPVILLLLIPLFIMFILEFIIKSYTMTHERVTYFVETGYMHYKIVFMPCIIEYLTILIKMTRYKGFRSAISVYYRWGLEEKKSKLNELRKEKKKKLEEVKNTTVYTKAKIILDKYDVPEEEPLICDEYDD